MKVSEKTYKSMPDEIQALFTKLPNPGKDEVMAGFPKNAGGRWGKSNNQHPDSLFWGKGADRQDDIKGRVEQFIGDTGSAARFFKYCPPDPLDAEDARRFVYCAKASKRDRDEGLEEFDEQNTAAMQGNLVDGQRLAGNGTPIKTPARRNTHSTVKSTFLMQYLCRLITPPGGVILDPFAGSGSTGKGALLEGFDFIGIEQEAEYISIAEARLKHAAATMDDEQYTVTRKEQQAGMVPLFDDWD